MLQSVLLLMSSAKVRKATETIDFYGHSVQNFDLNIQNQSSVWTPDQGGREGCKHKESLIFYEGFRHRCNTVTHSRHAGEGGAGLNINYCRLFITGEKYVDIELAISVLRHFTETEAYSQVVLKYLYLLIVLILTRQKF